MNFIRVWLYNFLAPMFMPALDQCNKANLKLYYANQEDHQKQLHIFMQDQREWMRKNSQSEDTLEKRHQELIATLNTVAARIQFLDIRRL